MIRDDIKIAALVSELNETDETEQLEAKKFAGDQVGKSVFETICAFANEPDLGGGTILLGVTKEESLFPLYKVTGVGDPDKISSDIATGCSTRFNSPLRVVINTELVDGQPVIRIDVAELPKERKPLYLKADGLPRGAFRRIGPTDVRCTDEDLQAFFQGKVQRPYDTEIVADASWEDIDPGAIAAYRKAREDANSSAEELNWSDEDMLHALGAVAKKGDDVSITLTGLIVFGKSSSIRRHLPTHRVDYVRVPGNTWVEDPEVSLDSVDMRGPIMTLIGRVIATITDDLPKTLEIGESATGQRREIPVLPIRVIREAVVNTLMHRSYEVHEPIQIIRYGNRLVLQNPGFSLKAQERLDEPGSAIRNPTIAAILHETRFAETKGSGIRVMQEKMRQSGLAAPNFESDRTRQLFRATFLFHHFLDEKDWNWLASFADLNMSEEQMRGLIFVREVGALDNATYRSLTGLDTLAASRSLRGLVDHDLLQLKGSGARAHYIAGKEMLERERSRSKLSIYASSANIHASTLDGDEDVSLLSLPIPLRVSVRMIHLQKRVKPDDMKKTIIKLCDYRPYSMGELAKLLAKQPRYLAQKYVFPMVSDGDLAQLYPEMPQHPGQKYLTPRLRESL